MTYGHRQHMISLFRAFAGSAPKKAKRLYEGPSALKENFRYLTGLNYAPILSCGAEEYVMVYMVDFL